MNKLNGVLHGFNEITLNNHEPLNDLEISLSRKIREYFDAAKTIVLEVDHLQEDRKLILIADDEPLMYGLVEEFLTEANIPSDLVTASNGNKAFELAECLAPDLIIVDLLMPEFDGMTLIKKLKQNHLTKDIPVILISGVLAGSEQLDEFFDAGAVDFIRKPIDYSELKARVKSALLLDESIKESKLVRESFAIRGEVLNHLVTSTPMAIFYLDGNGKCLGCNANFENLLQIKKIEILFQPFENFLPPSISDALELQFSTLTNPGMRSESEVTYYPGNFQQKQLLISLSRFGGLSNALVVGTMTEKAAEQDKERGSVSSNIEKLQADLEFKERELAMHTQLLIHARTAKEELLDGVNKLQPYLNLEGKSKLFALVKQLQRQLNDETTLSVERKFDELHASLYYSLEKYCPDITKNEKRLCAYLKMNHSAADIAKITNRSLNSINVGFARLRTKLRLPNNKNLRVFLNELTVTSSQPTEWVPRISV